MLIRMANLELADYYTTACESVANAKIYLHKNSSPPASPVHVLILLGDGLALRNARGQLETPVQQSGQLLSDPLVGEHCSDISWTNEKRKYNL